MLEVTDIKKSWNGVEALGGVSLRLDSGRIHGLIGADGAGKSTLFDILVTLTAPDSGGATVAGMDIRSQWRQIRSTVGYMPAQFSLYGDLSVMENLSFFANIYHRSVDDVSIMGKIWEQIAPFANRPASALSGGMKQKLALCCAMIHNPPVVMLDEPTTGVDPTSRREFWEALRLLADQGKTILVSTSYMDEAAKCDSVTMLHEGRVIADLDPRTVADHYHGTIYNVMAPGSTTSVARALREWASVRACYTFGDGLHLTTDDGLSPDAIIAYLGSQGFERTIISAERITPSVEDLFIQRITEIRNER